MARGRRGVLLCGPARTTLAAIARALVRADMPIVIQAAPAEVAASRRLRPARAAAGAVHIVGAELGGADASRALLEAARKATRGVAAVVICPKVSVVSARTNEIELREWDDGIAAGLRTPFFLAQQAAFALGRAGGGRLVFAADGAADGPVARVLRAGLLCMVDALAKAVPRGVSVAAVLAGAGPARRNSGVAIGTAVRFCLEVDALTNGAVLDLGRGPARG